MEGSYLETEKSLSTYGGEFVQTILHNELFNTDQKDTWKKCQRPKKEDWDYTFSRQQGLWTLPTTFWDVASINVAEIY